MDTLQNIVKMKSCIELIKDPKIIVRAMNGMDISKQETVSKDGARKLKTVLWKYLSRKLKREEESSVKESNNIQTRFNFPIDGCGDRIPRHCCVESRQKTKIVSL